MGAELKCQVTIEGVDREGTAWLEGDHILFRGADYRVKLPLTGLTPKAVDGRLELGRVVFHLGAQAAKWADKIANPKSLLDKLGVKPGLSVAVLGVKAAEFLAQLTEPSTKLKQNQDLVFLGIEKPADLARLAAIRAKLAPTGAVWLIYPKGGKAITENEVRQATSAAGLVDVKVVAFSKTHTAVKVVIPTLAR